MAIILDLIKPIKILCHTGIIENLPFSSPFFQTFYASVSFNFSFKKNEEEKIHFVSNSSKRFIFLFIRKFSKQKHTFLLGYFQAKLSLNRNKKRREEEEEEKTKSKIQEKT